MLYILSTSKGKRYSALKPVYSIKLIIIIAIMCDFIDYDLLYRNRTRSKIVEEEDQDTTKIDLEEIQQQEQPIAVSH